MEVLAAARLAGQRLGEAGPAGVPALNISLAQVMERTRALTEIIETGRGLLSRSRQVELTHRVLRLPARTALIKPRKKRSGPHALRQPVKSWPKRLQAAMRRPVLVFVEMFHAGPIHQVPLRGALEGGLIPEESWDHGGDGTAAVRVQRDVFPGNGEIGHGVSRPATCGVATGAGDGVFGKFQLNPAAGPASRSAHPV
jgi:hypothetical protein